MPKKLEIERRARELYVQDCYRKGVPELSDLNPEVDELKQNGFWNVAVSELMTGTERKNEQWLNVDFPENFSVDVDLLFDSGGLILGSKHVGKSDVAMLIADKCMEKYAIVICFDPSLDWITRSSIRQYAKVDSHTVLDVPKESVIYDVSLCSPQEQQKIMENFTRKLFEYQAQTENRKQYLLILEEAHTYFYQGCMRSKNLMNVVKLASVGRNVQIATLLLSQFSSALDKYLIKHNTSQVWLGYTREPNDIRYLRQIIGESVSELPKLSDGTFLYLTRDNLQKIAIEPYECNTAKTQIFSKIPQLEPLKPIQQKANSDGIIDILKFITCAGIVIYALINMPK